MRKYSASYAKIVVADWDTWRPLRNSFKWRDNHVNTSGTVYYENDVVKVRHGINNDQVQITKRSIKERNFINLYLFKTTHNRWYRKIFTLQQKC